MYDPYQQNSGALIASVVVSLVITVLAYGAVPMLVALCRDSEITKSRYRWTCYGVNIAVMVLFEVINGNASVSGWPYLLWTSVFVAWGSRILENKELLLDGKNKPSRGTRALAGQVSECMECGYQGDYGRSGCPKCGSQRRRYVYTQPVDANGTVSYCLHCGASLRASDQYCINCGHRVAPKK